MSRIEMAMEKAARLRQEGRPEEVATGESQLHTSYPSIQEMVRPSSPFLLNVLDPQSPIAEEYRKLKTVLVKLTEGEPCKNTLMITSALPNEGKSLTALNLAISLAQEFDHTVLLIDADLRRPSLHRYLGVEQGMGLSDLLSGKAKVSETIFPTGIGKLTLIRAGGQVDNPVELFSSQKMKGVLDEMKHRYPDRYVIFDTPPLLPFAETRALSHLVDGVLFVVRERLSSQRNLKEGVESLKGNKLLGLVYNGAHLDANDERNSYYDAYRRQRV